MMIQRAKMAAIGFCIGAMAVGALAVSANARQDSAPAAGAATTVTAVPAPLSPEAQAALDKGIIAAKLDPPDYPLALRYFEEARTHAPDSPAVFFHLGLAESKLPGRELRAICWFAAYLAAEPDAPNAAAVKEQITAMNVRNESVISRLLASLQDAVARESDLEASSDSFGSISPREQRDDDLVRVSKLWLATGDVARARSAVDLINYANHRTDALLDVAESLATRGDVSGAKKAIVVASAIVERIASEHNRSIWRRDLLVGWTKGRISSVQVLVGDLSGAQDTISRVEDPLTVAKGQLRIAKAQARSGHIGEAQQSLSKAWVNADRVALDMIGRSVKVLAEIANEQRATGDIRGADATTASVNRAITRLADTHSEIYFDLDLIEAQLDVGDINGALDTAVITEPTRRTDAWLKIARAQTKAGDKAAARASVANAVAVAGQADDWHRGEIWESIATVQVELGDYDGAIETARRLQDTPQRRKLLCSIANATRTGSMGASDWLTMLDSEELADECPLKAPPFQDLAGHLSSLPPSDDPLQVVNALFEVADVAVRARSVVLERYNEMIEAEAKQTK